MPQWTVLSVVTGSRAYGLAVDGSDVDRRGVFVTPTELFWRLDKPPTHVEGPLPEQFSWEIERFCLLALQANPTVLECLWSPLIEHSTSVGDRLLAIRRAFLSRRAEQTFVGYAERLFRRSDFGRPRQRKAAMHVIRLLLSGLHLVRHGEPLVQVGEHCDRLLAVRNGDLDWGEVCGWRDELLAEIGAAESVLPGLPDRVAVEEVLMDVRRASL
ncbi:nucleotidyltransferase domain-containing protein [Sphaerimonospora thailandensis]|nr:nucleotidyltransferase domain-containing protein [Sphaerimonospora thailandensis]